MDCEEAPPNEGGDILHKTKPKVSFYDRVPA